MSFLYQPPSAAQLGMATAFLEFCDEFCTHQTITRRQRPIPVSDETFVREFRARWAKVKPIFNADQELQLQREVEAIAAMIAEKRKNSAKRTIAKT